ncbi:MAG TPA: GerW family sporulation protein [Clostridia bacterium]
MDQNALTQSVDTLFNNLGNFTHDEGVIGKAFIHGDKTFIPVVSIALGYGSGNTASKAQAQGGSSAGSSIPTPSGNMSGGALGLGAKLSTEAVIVIDKDNISVLPMASATNTSQLVDKLPQMIMGVTQNKLPGQSQDQSQGQSQGQTQGQGMGQTPGSKS